MKSTQHRLLRYAKNKWTYIGLAVVVVIILIISTRGHGKANIETAVASVGNVVEKVSVTGKVSPTDKADLAFEKSGVVVRIAAKVGDSVRKGDMIASLDSATDAAALASAEATLSDMSRSLTPEELAVEKTSLDNAEKDAVNASHDGLVKAESAVFNYADDFFDNPQSANPVLNVRAQSTTEQLNIDFRRLVITDLFKKWSDDLSSSGAGGAASIISKSHNYLSTVKDFLSTLSAIINNMNPGNSGLPQAVIEADVASMNTALSTLNAGIDSVTAAESALSTAKSNYNLKLAGNSAQSIAAQAAKVAQARAELSKDWVTSPISGTITRVEPKTGEFVAAGESVFTVQTVGEYKIEAYVPEADIAKISIGDSASVTLDAYGQTTIFPASVTLVDPAETVIEGVPTYKVTLYFSQADARIRSGMTANTDIMTHEADGVIVLPTRSVIDDPSPGAPAGSKVVRVLKPDGKTFANVPVTVGLKGSDGMIEIKSGISAGEKVVTYVK